jgi:hypothetical protein
MAGAANRQTLKNKDGVYYLLGIFSIFMPPIYDEKKENALKRLQMEIDRLPATGITSIVDCALSDTHNLPPMANTCFTILFDRNPQFMGRESILINLEWRLFIGE